MWASETPLRALAAVMEPSPDRVPYSQHSTCGQRIVASRHDGARRGFFNVVRAHDGSSSHHGCAGAGAGGTVHGGAVHWS
jgi:hypothetical protein